MSSREPSEPPYACPHIDEAIEAIEKARAIAEALRDWGNYWKDRAEEIQQEYDTDIALKNNEIQDLQERIEILEEEARNLSIAETLDRSV